MHAEAQTIQYPASGGALLIEVAEYVCSITLNRPESMNTVNEEIRHALPIALRAADSDPAVRVIVLRGAGDRAFCAGADIREFRAPQAPVQYRQNKVHQHWVAAFEAVRKPMIAAIQGYCLGGGLEIALACDLRIAARNAQFGFPETGLGILPGAGGTQRITRVLGMSLALDLVLSGRRLDAETALAVGLVSRLVDAGDLAEQSRVFAESIAARPPLAVQLAKEAVLGGRELPLAEGMRLESDLQSLLVNTEDSVEAANAFREKRKPVFKGR